MTPTNRPNTLVSPAPVGWRTLAEKVYYTAENTPPPVITLVTVGIVYAAEAELLQHPTRDRKLPGSNPTSDTLPRRSIPHIPLVPVAISISTHFIATYLHFRPVKRQFTWWGLTLHPSLHNRHTHLHTTSNSSWRGPV